MGKKKLVLNKTVADEIIAKYADGAEIIGLSAHYGLSYSAITAILLSNDVVLRKHPSQGLGRLNKREEEDYKLLKNAIDGGGAIFNGEKQKQVIYARFGLDNSPVASFGEIAYRFSMSQYQVGKIYRDGLTAVKENYYSGRLQNEADVTIPLIYANQLSARTRKAFSRRTIFAGPCFTQHGGPTIMDLIEYLQDPERSWDLIELHGMRDFILPDAFSALQKLGLIHLDYDDWYEDAQKQQEKYMAQKKAWKEQGKQRKREEKQHEKEEKQRLEELIAKNKAEPSDRIKTIAKDKGITEEEVVETFVSKQAKDLANGIKIPLEHYFKYN